MAKTESKKAAGPKKSPARTTGTADKASAGNAAKPKEAAAKAEKAAEPQVSQAKLEALRKPVEVAKGGLEKAQAEAKALAGMARAVVTEAKDAYRAALAPYRENCRKAGVECEYEGGRSANLSEKVSFLVEKTDKGVRVMVEGQPKTEEVIPSPPSRSRSTGPPPPTRRSTSARRRRSATRAARSRTASAPSAALNPAHQAWSKD